MDAGFIAVGAELESLAIQIAKEVGCGAEQTVDGSTRLVLCCDPTLVIDRYAQADCECLKQAVDRALGQRGVCLAKEERA